MTVKYEKRLNYLIRSSRQTYVYYLMAKTKLCPAGNYMFKVNNRNTRTRCEICSKLTTKTPERRQCRGSGVF